VQWENLIRLDVSAPEDVQGAMLAIDECQSMLAAIRRASQNPVRDDPTWLDSLGVGILKGSQASLRSLGKTRR
jgi:hypothetical protein